MTCGLDVIDGDRSSNETYELWIKIGNIKFTECCTTDKRSAQIKMNRLNDICKNYKLIGKEI